MSRRRMAGLAALGLATAVIATACSSGSSTVSTSPSSSTGTGAGTPASGFNAAVTNTVNASSHAGGTLTFANSSAPDSTDPGGTYYAFNLNFSRLYATPLTTYKACAGTCGQQVVPGLATTLGIASDGNKTWTYHLKSGVVFEDGTPVTSADIKYAVERTFDRTVLPNGPTYFTSLLAGTAALPPGKGQYPGPFKNPKNIPLTS